MNTFVYISGWDKRAEPGGRYGLSAYRLLPDGGLSFVETAEPDTLFNVTCFDARRGLLYALEEVNDLPGLRGGGGGHIFVFRPDRETGRLETIGSAPEVRILGNCAKVGQTMDAIRAGFDAGMFVD